MLVSLWAAYFRDSGHGIYAKTESELCAFIDKDDREYDLVLEETVELGAEQVEELNQTGYLTF